MDDFGFGAAAQDLIIGQGRLPLHAYLICPHLINPRAWTMAIGATPPNRAAPLNLYFRQNPSLRKCKHFPKPWGRFQILFGKITQKSWTWTVGVGLAYRPPCKFCCGGFLPNCAVCRSPGGLQTYLQIPVFFTHEHDDSPNRGHAPHSGPAIFGVRLAICGWNCENNAIVDRTRARGPNGSGWPEKAPVMTSSEHAAGANGGDGPVNILYFRRKST